ncbi:hypothetical protein SanaruYs_21570 [Chryseotalea sanaruensis]|uniref:Uncharacterized protein n=1 Tax=Chryseotalea sanaruensis TaxID=2482724 RepID=A0A401UAJ1_9BACT|nr:hypothetical protein [Chryseotalea sanaruensis]GCC51926.1 hypothetical protein SanaruYs_21570 [Chryseotalea sanaruensis]
MKRLLPYFLILLISCEDNDLGLESNPIDSKIIIEAREVLEPNSRRLNLFCRTEKIYPCVNYPIIADEEIDANSFKITFTEVGETVLCLTAFGPATVVIDLNSVANGEYEIELNNAKLRNKGTLKVTDTDISFQFGKRNGIDFIRTTTMRVPNNTYWGTIGYHVASSSTLVDEFIQKFVDAGANFGEQLPGHYFYYEIDNAGDIVTNAENSGYYFMRNFIFQYDGDETELEQIVEVEGKNFKEALSIRLSTYEGETFYNWGD